MLLVEESVESSVEGLDLSLGGTAEEPMTLGELDGVMQHVQLWKRVLSGLRTPVLMDVDHHSAPSIDIGSTPVVRAEQAMMELLQPAGEDRVRCLYCCWDISNSCEECRTAFSLNPLADLRPVEVVEVALPTAAG